MASKKKIKPIQPRHIPACIKEALAMHEAFRRLGFSADDIFCVYYQEQIAIELHTQGKEFVVTCGNHDFPEEKFPELWKRACALWNGTEPGMTGTTREIIYRGSELMKGGHIGIQLIGALQAKGIDPPAVRMLEKLAGVDPGSFGTGVNSKGGTA